MKEIKNHAGRVRDVEEWEEEAIAEAMAKPAPVDHAAAANLVATHDAQRAVSARKSNNQLLSVRLPPAIIEMIEKASPGGKAGKRSRRASGLREVLDYYKHNAKNLKPVDENLEWGPASEVFNVKLPALTIEMIAAQAPGLGVNERGRKAAGLRAILRFYQYYEIMGVEV